MIARASLDANLQTIDALFQKAANQQESLLLAKLASLELCGWIEEAMDEIVLSCAQRSLSHAEHLKLIANDVVKKTSQFDYENNFRRMLVHVIGLKGIESIERIIDQTKFVPFVSVLNALKDSRNKLAHTHSQHGFTISVDAPSVTAGHFQTVFDGLSDVEAKLQASGF